MNNEEMAVKIAEHGKEIGSIKHRVDDLEEQTNIIHELVVSVKELAMNIQSMVKEQERYGKSQVRAFERIEALEKKPVKRYETIVTVLITSIVSGLVAFAIAQILP